MTVRDAFETNMRSECIDYIQNHLTHGDQRLVEQVSGLVADELCYQEELKHFPGFRVGSFVVRGEDLGLFDVLEKGLIGFLAPMHPELVAACIALVKLICNLWKRGVKLSATEIAILSALETQGALSLPALKRVLEKHELRVDKKQLEQLLQGLTSKTSISGTGVISLVVETPSGWAADH